MKNHYKDKIKKKIIRNYISTHYRSPTRAEVFELLRAEMRAKPNINSIGFSGFDIEPPNFREVSSASVRNENCQAIRDDIVIFNKQLDDITRTLEESFRGYSSIVNKCLSENRELDSKLNNILMLSDESNIFLHGIEESFETHKNIDLEKSTVQANIGYVTLGRRKFKKTDLSNASLSFRTRTSLNILTSKVIHPLTNLNTEDGSLWRQEILTRESSGPVEASIIIDFNEPKGVDIGEIRLTGNPVDGNSTSWVTVYTSLDGSSYSMVRPANTRLVKGENLVPVGKKKVKKIKVFIGKDAPDFSDGDTNMYIFSLDSIEVITGDYKIDESSVLYAGPYSITDEDNNPVNFSLATIDHGTCCIIPDQTSVSFFLSKDNTNWMPAAFNGESMDVVQFGSTLPENKARIDTSKNELQLISDSTKVTKFDFEISEGREAVCNVYIDESEKHNFVKNNVKIKRNLYRSGEKVYGIQKGWLKDKKTLQYSTYLEVKDFEGKAIDLGPTSALLNDRPVTGRIHVPKGIHKFVTDHSNWYDIPVSCLNSEELRSKDPCYPYNHKAIIEGYDYPSIFVGDKLYTGYGIENFGALLSYVSPEVFGSPEFDRDLTIYTIEEYNGSLFFRIKLDPSDGSWTEEEVSVDYMLRNNEENNLYVKAVLRTKLPAITPNISKFQVRVI